MGCWIVIRAFSSEVGTGSREENASKREAGAGQGSRGANYKISSPGPIPLPLLSEFSTSCLTPVHHASVEGMTDFPRKHRRGTMPQLTCRGHAPKTRHQT